MDKVEFENCGPSHIIESNVVMTDCDTGRVVAVFYNDYDCQNIIDMQAENERLTAEIEMFKSATIAPTDSGIVNFDSMCSEFNEGKRSMASLCFSLWNTSRLQK